MCKDNAIYSNQLLPYQFSRNFFQLISCQPCLLKILINIFTYTNNFCKTETQIDHEELGKYLLRNATAMQYITYLLPTQHLKGILLATLMQS